MHNLTWEHVYMRAVSLAASLRPYRNVKGATLLYGVPNGGIPAAQAVAGVLGHDWRLTTDVDAAHVIVDDIIDSGATRERFRLSHPKRPFFALVNKKEADPEGWYSFPWERMAKVDGPRDNIRRLLQYIGEDPDRAGLAETPDRVVRSYSELFGGYKKDPASVFKTFDEPCDEMILCRNIEFASTCEHHMLPFLGTAHIAYIPNGKVIGLSKLARLLEVYSRRLQIQERIGIQITGALNEHLQPLGSACVLEAKHLCMSCRGVNKQHSEMVTSSLTGVFRTQSETRHELFQLIRGN